MSGDDYNTFSPNAGVFDGSPVNSGDTVIKYTYTGDINLDGLVNDDDLALFLGAYLGDQTGNYALGDMNFDTLVNDDDLALFLGNYLVPPASPLGGLEGFGTNLGQFLIQEGQSTTQIWGNVPDASTLGFHAERIGDANPNFLWSFVNDLTVKRFNLHALAEWQHGGDLINLTKLIWDFGGTTIDCPTACNQRLAGFGKDTRAWLESATYFKLRDLTLSYTLPTGVFEWTGARDARASISGRNLIVVTGRNYTGMDPEVSNFGIQPVARNIEVAQYPRSRSFWFTLSVGF